MKKEDTFPCADCEQEFDRNKLTEVCNGDLICDECLESYVCCEGCNEYIHSDDSTEVNDKFYCETCFEAHYTTCNHCGDVISRDGDRPYSCYSEIHDQYYCEDCYNEYFCYCENCDSEMAREDAHWVNERCLCEECAENEEDNRTIHDYGYKPQPAFMGNSRLYLGVELEVENHLHQSCNEEIAEHIQDDYTWLYCKHDGSLNNGFEIVSHPFSYEVYETKLKNEWRNLLVYLSTHGFYSYKPRTCGIHIHLSKKAFGSLHLYKFLKFFYENPKFILTISQRGSMESLRHYASVLTDDDDSIIYKAKHKDNRNRYTAVNLQNDHTVEVRIFRGTLNVNSFMKNMEFVKAVFDYTNTESLPSVSVARFIDYVNENKKEFKNLQAFLEVKNLTNERSVQCA